MKRKLVLCLAVPLAAVFVCSAALVAALGLLCYWLGSALLWAALRMVRPARAEALGGPTELTRWLKEHSFFKGFFQDQEDSND